MKGFRGNFLLDVLDFFFQHLSSTCIVYVLSESILSSSLLSVDSCLVFRHFIKVKKKQRF